MQTQHEGSSGAGLIRHLLFALGALLTYPACVAIYNLYWHPLSRFPGPSLWAAFRLPYAVALWRGEYVQEIYQIHERYGDIVRVAPNELSFANKQAWQDIHCFRSGHKPFPKNPIWYGDFPGRSPSIVTTLDHTAHERMRKLLNYCFSAKALKGQEQTIQYHTNLMIRKLRERVHDKIGMTVNIAEWYTFLTSDILGDLGFGESFDCLENSTLHHWIGSLFNYFKISMYLGLLRIYVSVSIDSFLMKCAPKTVVKTAEDHYGWAVEKVHRRMNKDTQREDFISHILNHNDKDGMTISEIENNTNVLIVAGSETCATVLSGMTNYLIKSPTAYHTLTAEVRSTFSKAEDMTFKALSDLPYLNAVVEEGLRMSPPNPSGLAHLVPAGGDTVCGYWLPEGTYVSVHQWSLFRSKNKFHQPNTFLPERWLTTSKSSSASPFYNDDLAAVQAFSTGTWSCIGKQFAYAELRVVLAKMVWNFDISVAIGGRDVDWTKQKCWFVMEKQPFDVRLVDAML